MERKGKKIEETYQFYCLQDILYWKNSVSVKYSYHRYGIFIYGVFSYDWDNCSKCVSSPKLSKRYITLKTERLN